jgi:hypothetical protein
MRLEGGQRFLGISGRDDFESVIDQDLDHDFANVELIFNHQDNALIRHRKEVTTTGAFRIQIARAMAKMPSIDRLPVDFVVPLEAFPDFPVDDGAVGDIRDDQAQLRPMLIDRRPLALDRRGDIHPADSPFIRTGTQDAARSAAPDRIFQEFRKNSGAHRRAVKNSGDRFVVGMTVAAPRDDQRPRPERIAVVTGCLDGDVERDVEGGDTLPMPMSGDFMCQLNTNALVQLAVGPGTSEFTGGFGAVDAQRRAPNKDRLWS